MPAKFWPNQSEKQYINNKNCLKQDRHIFLPSSFKQFISKYYDTAEFNCANVDMKQESTNHSTTTLIAIPTRQTY